MKAGKSRSEWSQEKDFQNDYDFITSQLSLATKNSEIRKSYWKVLVKNINGSYKSIANFIKWGKEETVSKAVLNKWKKNDDFYVFKFTEEDKSRKFESENEWYISEYRRQIGEPPQEDHDTLMKRAIMALKWQSLLDFNRILYRPPVQHELELEQPSWQDTPLAITCTCPTGDGCSCFDRKAYLLPTKSIPWKVPDNILGIKMFCCFCCEPKGVFSSKLVKETIKEGEYYRSTNGRKQLMAKGPEFCMSRCMQYMAASTKLDAKLAAEIGKMQAQIDSAGLEGVGAFGSGGQEFDVPDVMDTSRVCDAYTCTEATQTENDPETGALLMGEYTHVLYGAPEQTVMSDAEGTRLEISNYV